MATIRIELYKSKILADGRFPVCIRVTHNGVRRRKAVASAFLNEWDDANKRIVYRKDRHKVNQEIDDEFDFYESVFKGLSKSGKDWKADDVFKSARNTNHNLTDKKRASDIAKLYGDEKAKASGWTSLTVESIFSKFIAFAGDIYPEDITADLISRYVDYLRHELGNKDSTINTNIKYMRMAMTWAANKKYCEKPEELYSFKLPPRGRGVKVKLSDGEVEGFSAAVVTADTRMEEALSVWLLAYYFRGMRISDVLQIKEVDVTGDRFEYIAGKNKKHFNVKIQNEARKIIDKYTTGSDYLFSFFKWKSDPRLSISENNRNKATEMKRATAHVNNRLAKIAKQAGIEKRVSTHTARHYFAKRALDMIRRSNFENATNVSMSLLGHSDLKEHELYVKEILSEDVLDDAADKIFGGEERI